MLARRRQAASGQQRGRGVAPATTAAGAAASSAGTPAVPVSTTPGAGLTSSPITSVIEDRLAAFSPYVLPSLINDKSLDEDAGVLCSGGKDLEAATLVEGSHPYSARLTQAILLMYLHIGSDPPDFPRIEPCAKTECWVDPLVAHVSQYGPHGRSGGGGCDSIAETLERQYRSVLSEDLHVVRVVEASIDVSRSVLMKGRRMAREGRLLIHYNGHGMPRATELGEVWMFDKERTHYVPLNIAEAAEIVGSPAMYVMDCNSAGSILKRWCKDGHHERRPHDFFICACGPGETLPLNPVLPADMLTSCLTTPLRMALEWYIGYSHYKVLLPHVTEDMIRHLPGDLNDRRSPRGELNAILGAITTSVAWCTLPPARFHLLFRHDSATRSLFRNAVLADRLMREAGCTPVTHPPLSEEAHLHPLWELWEYTLERAISQLPSLMSPDSTHVYEPSDFFDNQLTAFEVWVRSGDMSQLPEQLPCVLLALAQQIYRVRAFTLLAKYLDSGRMSGKRAILCGVLPYLSHLLTQAPEVFLTVAVLWMQVVRADPAEACTELQKSQCERYFTTLLKLDESVTRIEPVEYGQNVVYAASASTAGSPQYAGGSHPSPTNRRGSGVITFLTTTTANNNATSSLGSGSPRGNARQPASAQQNMNHANGNSQHYHTGEAMQQGGILGGGGVSSGIAEPAAASAAALAADSNTGAVEQPLQPAPRLNAIATHAVQPGGAVYYLMKDVDLSRCKSMSCYILCQFMLRGERQCLTCWNNRLLNAAFPCLSSPKAELRSWACLVLARLFSGLRHAKNFASRECASRVDLFTRLLQDRSPIVRSSCVTLLASTVGVRIDVLPSDQQVRRLQMEKSLLIKLRNCLFDASVSVREELVFFASQILYSYRGALPSSKLQIHDYVLEVGRQSSKWVLDEPDVQVKSQLNAGRPTLNAKFDDVPVFDTVFLTSDDPPPPTREVDTSMLTLAALEIMQGLLHDAALMLCTLYTNCDGNRVNQALRVLSTGAAPQSHRFASEALRTMSSVASLDSSHYLSEADRARSTWNADMMRQLVLDMSNRRLEPHPRVWSPTTSNGGDAQTFPVNGARSNNNSNQGSGSDSATHRGHNNNNTNNAINTSRAGSMSARYQVLPSALRSDTVVCSTFRALDASMVVATKNQQVSVISYDNYSSQSVTNTLTLRLAGPVHDVLVINDLSEQSGLLVVNKRGGFSLLKSCWEKDSIPTEAAVFSACPPPPPNTWLDIKSTYRTSTATLLYGGRISESFETEIHILSLSEEQVVQRLEVSGNPALMCLVSHTTQRAVMAGFSDGVVRYYDDRQKQGQLGTVGMMVCRNSAQPSAAVEAVIGAGPIASGAGGGGSTHFTVVAATSSAVRLFDIRKTNEPTAVYTHTELYGGNAGGGGGSNASSSAPLLTSCSVGVHTGMIALAFADNTYAAYNAKGLVLNDGPILASGYSAASSPVGQDSLSGNQAGSSNSNNSGSRCFSRRAVLRTPCGP